MFREFAAEGRLQPWQQAVSDVLFPVETASAVPDGFSGCLKSWDLGEVSMAFMASGPVTYQRERHHLAADKEEILLVSFATNSEIAYAQDGLELTCRRNQVLVERSHRPSLFVQPLASNALWVLKVPMRVMKRRLRAIDQMPSLVADAGSGAAGLLHDMLRLAPTRLAEAGAAVRDGVGRTLVDLLVLALENDVRALNSRQSPVRQAHLARIEGFVRRNLSNPALGPDMVAGACGISVRYLNALFRDAGGLSLGQWVCELRLEAARDQLADPARAGTIAEIARRWGFLDQAQFSRRFKARFGVTPRELRRGPAQ
ncbi:AraC family transcriptional regulator [Zavarzinia compransoris]|uniref:AraC family transcriptional regulator n=1 Tax=Zavarzinia compransoris TaxID=1264899 RepID=A0A317E2R6_9PROT|nr:AraC family transcriptional regulator [Zavarzinia compransoris]PWR20911.1 AraC family transcriptional regulator [Zavarzinia compransoris]TDP44251.1 AraC-like DNA-binding protein [Zavarzinia compransoris]